MDLKLDGKRALITGSTAGIGEAIAMTMAREGAAVVVNGRSERRGKAVVEAIRAAGGTAVLALGDVASNAGADATCEAAIAALGGVDIVVNNAAGFASESSIASFFDVTSDAWLRTYDMNVGGAVRMMQRLVPGMQEQGWGRVINIGSSGGWVPSGELPDYGVAKTALMGLTTAAAKALAGTGVTVNCVLPGITYTRSVAAWFKAIGAREGWGDDRAKSEAFVLAQHPQTVARIGEVDDVATMVAYLASPLSGFINQVNLRIDGGAFPAVG
jgi:Dehydrogenases with different specificities (related to short-chain alcohol dehydrogenases)